MSSSEHQRKSTWRTCECVGLLKSIETASYFIFVFKLYRSQQKNTNILINLLEKPNVH